MTVHCEIASSPCEPAPRRLFAVANTRLQQTAHESCGSGRAILIRDGSACADVVGDIAGRVGEADHRLRADVCDHAVKTFSTLLVEQFLSEAFTDGYVCLNNFFVERRYLDQVIADLGLDRRTDHVG